MTEPVFNAVWRLASILMMTCIPDCQLNIIMLAKTVHKLLGINMIVMMAGLTFGRPDIDDGDRGNRPICMRLQPPREMCAVDLLISCGQSAYMKYNTESEQPIKNFILSQNHKARPDATQNN
jgi:hypothetical protein